MTHCGAFVTSMEVTEKCNVFVGFKPKIACYLHLKTYPRSFKRPIGGVFQR